MDLEYFWAIVAWAVVIGGGLLGAFVFYYWFAVVPDRVLGEERARSRAVPALVEPRAGGQDVGDLEADRVLTLPRPRGDLPRFRGFRRA